MKLEDFDGKKFLLDAVDFEKGFVCEREANVIYVRLNFEVYGFYENPDDGYRSMLGDIEKENRLMKNTFPAILVEGNIRTLEEWKKLNGDPEEKCTLELSGMDGRLIVEVGTGNTNDYYPFYVASFYPENIGEYSGVI